MEYLILFLPLIGSIISGFSGKKIGDRNSQILTSSLVGISAILSFIVLYKVILVHPSQKSENGLPIA